jgi:hypothetical protein
MKAIFPPRTAKQLHNISCFGQSLFGADSGVLSDTAWIPDTLRSFLAHEVGNDGLPGTFPLAANVDDWRRRRGKSAILDLVSERSERSERRVSGIHALTQRNQSRSRTAEFSHVTAEASENDH